MEGDFLDFRSFPKCEDVLELGPQIGSGASSSVYEVTERRTGRKLAVKIVKITPENENFVKEECDILTKLPKHDNIIDLYDIFYNGTEGNEEVWIVMELCAGTVVDFLRKMHQKTGKIEEPYIVYILKGLVQAITHLHENRIIHRDIRGNNLLFTKNGEIRLIDFGISKSLRDGSVMVSGRIGSPSWMAPEMISLGGEYDHKVDVWALGITAIELAEGKAPFEDMNPAGALFQILRNPPPTLFQSSNWSHLLNDFINECLEKNSNNRPVIQEFLEHPIFVTIDSTSDLQSNIISLMKEDVKQLEVKKFPEILVKEEVMKLENHVAEEKILQDDLALLRNVTEKKILNELELRMKKKHFCSFAGDILLAINPNTELGIHGIEYHEKYRFKARSDNPPHIYSVADSAYQEAIHHEEPQQILLTGETMSGKTTNMLYILNHLLFLGQGNNCGQNIEKSLSVIHTLGNAETSNNPNSTRHILQTELSFTATGKISGAIFWIYQLEKNRVTLTDRNMRNFHIFYYFYDALKTEGILSKYFLESETYYEFLRDGDPKKDKKSAEENYKEFLRFERNLNDLGFEEDQLWVIRKILAAIIILGEIQFESDKDGHAKITTQKLSDAVADLLGLDHKKFSWALIKYCVIIKGEAVMRYHTQVESIEAKNVLAKGIYSRLVDWIINCINEKLSIPRAIYGDKYTINVLDFFGFECLIKNTMDQLIINCMNEQLQYFYGQKLFSLEMKNAEEEEIMIPAIQFDDNKMTMDQILSKPDGLMYLIDEANKNEERNTFISKLKKHNKNLRIAAVNENEFFIIHFTGKVVYTSSEILDKNRDFLPPEMIETMRSSSLNIVQSLFTGLLTKTGNLALYSNTGKTENIDNTTFKSFNKKSGDKKFSMNSKGQYSQSRQMRTTVTTFRATCLEILKTLMGNENNIHFIICIRPNLTNTPDEFQTNVISQQLRAFSVLETVKIRQQGYSYRVKFSDFIKRYRFLAFEFNENVEETKENCRLLLVRLKMEGWIIGKTMVFLNYCDKEYLSRLYGNNVRKIVKVQSMMRAFLARRNLLKGIRRFKEDIGKVSDNNDNKSRNSPHSQIRPKTNEAEENTSEIDSDMETENEEDVK